LHSSLTELVDKNLTLVIDIDMITVGVRPCSQLSAAAASTHKRMILLTASVHAMRGPSTSATTEH
jgi:hypothetical protein